MQHSLEDARFFYIRLESIIRGPEQGHDLEIIRRYFRAYMHCWKSILHYVQEVKGLKDRPKDPAWTTWRDNWAGTLSSSDFEVFECLRKTRDHDTHRGMIDVGGEVAMGLFPIVMFVPGKSFGARRELISVCERGLVVADELIRRH